MIRALYTAASGMNAQQANIDNVAHNLANVNTTGFKKSRLEFQDLVYQQARVAGTPTSAVDEAPVGLEMGVGTKQVATARDFSSGNLRQTGGPLDLAIEGQGFFQVQLPDGTVGYTRSGALHLSGEGRVVTNDGYTVEPQITIPSDATLISVSKDGIVSVSNRGRQCLSANRHDRAGVVSECRWPARARRQHVRADDRLGRTDDGRGGHRRARDDLSGLPGGFERQRRRGDGEHDHGTARLRGEFPRREGGRPDAVASQQSGAVMRAPLMGWVVLAAACTATVPAQAASSEDGHARARDHCRRAHQAGCPR